VYGNRLVLVVTSISLPIVPLLWLISDNFWWLLACQAASGLSWSGFTLSCGNLLYELVPRTRRAAYVAFHNVGTAAGVFAGAMLGAGLAVALPPRAVLFGDASLASNLLYLFALSGLTRAIIAALLARRIRDFRKPRREISAPALVMRVTGVNSMLGLIYDFIGRVPQPEADESDPGKAASQPAPPGGARARAEPDRADRPKTGDNT
jgi:MFS family permease